MWLSFFVAVALCAVFIYLPGYFAFKALRFSSLLSLCFAPLASILAFNVAALLCDKLGVFGNWVSIFLPCAVIFALAAGVSFALGRRKVAVADGPSPRGQLLSDGRSWLQWALYVVVGMLATGCIFVANLGSPDAFLQAFDNVFHLGTVRSFVESGCCSVFDSRLYVRELLGDNAIPFTAGGSSFYPTTWHLLAALVAGALGVQETVAVNAVNACIVGIVFPSSTFLLIKTIFEDKDHEVAVWAGAVCAVAFAAFPWDFLTFGPIYPNVLGYAVLPLAMVNFIYLFKPLSWQVAKVPLRIALFLIASCALLFAHSNALLTAVVLLTPFLCSWASGLLSKAKLPGSPKVKAVIGYAVCFLAVCVIWMGMYYSPFMQNGPLADWWPSYSGKFEAFKYLVALALKEPAQWVLAVVVIVGAVSVLRQKGLRWLTVSYLLTAVIFWAGICMDGMLKSVLAGFWYTDSHRLAAMVALAGIPLAALGLSTIVDAIKRLVFSKKNAMAPIGRVMAPAATAVIAVFALLNFLPVNVLGGAAETTAFGYLGTVVRGQNSQTANNIYGPEEHAFVRKVMETIGEDTLVINQPNDGSAFAAGVDGLNAYYRLLRGYGDDSELEQSLLIRHSLNKLASDASVAEAVAYTGAQYVLQLDSGDYRTKTSPYLWTYDDVTLWSGIDQIDDDTPGFEVVLSEGDMRLYQIVGAE